jgi:hypothetical protein
MGFFLKLKMWYREACAEVGVPVTKIDQSYAIYPKRFYKNKALKQEKEIDFIFIGAFYFSDGQRCGYKNRKWSINFAKKHFTNKSYFVNTSKDMGLEDPWVKLGEFDKTLEETCYLIPKTMEKDKRNTFDEKYFSNLAKSKFCLCPAGDKMYTFRLYEALMCKSIPIVDSREETFRNKKESKLGYKYYLTSSPEFIYRQDWVDHNYNLFIKYHTFELGFGRHD